MALASSAYSCYTAVDLRATTLCVPFLRNDKSEESLRVLFSNTFLQNTKPTLNLCQVLPIFQYIFTEHETHSKFDSGSPYISCMEASGFYLEPHAFQHRVLISKRAAILFYGGNLPNHEPPDDLNSHLGGANSIE